MGFTPANPVVASGAFEDSYSEAIRLGLPIPAGGGGGGFNPADDQDITGNWTFDNPLTLPGDNTSPGFAFVPKANGANRVGFIFGIRDSTGAVAEGLGVYFSDDVHGAGNSGIILYSYNGSYIGFDGSSFSLGGLPGAAGGEALVVIDPIHGVLRKQSQSSPFFGDGHDGAAVLDGVATFGAMGLVLVGSVYTMTQDIYCTDLTVDVGITLKTASYRVFCTGTLLYNGTISNDGKDAVGAAGGVAVSTHTLGGSVGGGAGGINNGTAGPSIVDAQSPAGAGGAGGDGGTGTGAAGGTIAAFQLPRLPFELVSFTAPGTDPRHPIIGGTGGGGGGGDTVHSGGGGGGGGGCMLLCVAALNGNGTGVLSVQGGVGADGVAGDAGGGGGGGGGVLIVLFQSLTVGSAAHLNGGSGGAGVGTGAVGVTGANGVDLFLTV